MKLKERYNLEKLRNRTSEIVFERIGKLLEERDDFCHCETCVLDLVAFTLNHVTPLYSTSLLGPLHPNKEKLRKVQIEIDLAIQAGLKRISKNPHHETGVMSGTQ